MMLALGVWVLGPRLRLSARAFHAGQMLGLMRSGRADVVAWAWGMRTRMFELGRKGAEMLGQGRTGAKMLMGLGLGLGRMGLKMLGRGLQGRDS